MGGFAHRGAMGVLRIVVRWAFAHRGMMGGFAHRSAMGYARSAQFRIAIIRQ